MALRIGLSVLTARPSSWGELRDAVVSVEDVGFDSVWVPDHIEKDLGGRTMSFYNSTVMLGAIAEATHHVVIGALVNNAAWHHPFRLVHGAAALAEISNDRFALSVGAGSGLGEYGLVDAPTDHAYSRFAESVKIMRRLLDGEEVTDEGRFWRTTGARVTGIEQYRIPLVVGATGPRSIDLAFRYGDEWNTFDLSGTPVPSVLADRISAADAAQTEHHRQVRRSVDLMVSPAPMPGMEHVPTISGTPDDIVESLTSFHDAGFDEIHCYGPPPSVVGEVLWRPIIDGVHDLT
ncbi:MAG: LLM class flavin-dependent oxidoreductase [Actinomycetota bacterium]